MSIRLKLALLALSGFCLAACMSSTTATEPEPPAEIDEPWQLELVWSGGFAGIERRFTASDESVELVVADIDRGTETAVVLTAEEHAGLARSVAALAGLPSTDLRSSSCADCYQFDMRLAVGSQRKPRLVRYDSLQPEETPEARLAARVITIGQRGASRGVQ